MSKKEKEGDKIFTRVEVCFSWRDRLRILFGKHLWVRIVTVTENIVGEASSKSMVNVDPLWKRKPVMAVMLGEERKDDSKEKSNDLMPPFHDGCKCVYNPETNDFETPGGDEYACPLCISMRGLREYRKKMEEIDGKEKTS